MQPAWFAAHWKQKIGVAGFFQKGYGLIEISALGGSSEELSWPAKPIFYSSLDLLCERLAVPLFNDAKHRALVRIA